MKKNIFFLLTATILLCCKKNNNTAPAVPVQQPQMTYTHLGDTGIQMTKAAKFDINADGQWDISFTTLLVGDPLNQLDKKQWIAGGSLDTYMPVSTDERMPVLPAGSVIAAGVFAGYNWYNAVAVCLTQKIIPMYIPPYWEGNWQNVQHHFMPLRINKNGVFFYGWVEMSFDTTAEKLILHRAAIAKQPSVAVKTGG